MLKMGHSAFGGSCFQAFGAVLAGASACGSQDVLVHCALLARSFGCFGCFGGLFLGIWASLEFGAVFGDCVCVCCWILGTGVLCVLGAF